MESPHIASLKKKYLQNSLVSSSCKSYPVNIKRFKSCGATDLSEFRFTQLVWAKPAEGPVQLEKLQRMAVQPPANQETREARSQEEKRAGVPLTDRRETW